MFVGDMLWRVCPRLVALCWLCHLLVLQAQEEDADILVAPENVTVGLNQGPTSFTCRIRRENAFVEIDGKIPRLDPKLNSTILDQRGIIVNPQTHVGTGNNTISTVNFSVDSIEANNNTRISCLGSSTDPNGQPMDIASPDAFFTITGPPLPPSLQYSAIDEHTLNLFWDEPYSASNITSYFLRVVDTYQTSPTLLNYTQLSPDIRAVNLTRENATSCTNLTIQVWAENEVGNSSLSRVNTAFLMGPGEFQKQPEITIAFSSDISPILNLEFIFPLLCPFNNATYVIEIEDASNMVVHTIGPTSQHWMEGGSPISMILRDIGLEADAEYILNITVWTAVGHTVSVTNFNTSTSTLQSSARSFNLTVVVAASIGGAVGAILLLIVLIMCIIYITRRTRKRKREIFHITEYSNGAVHINGSNRAALDSRGMPMVDNPIYEKDPIYEEINLHFPNQEEGYMSINAPAAANGSLEQSSPEKFNDEYTTMNPAGTLQGQLRVSGAGAAAITTPDKETGCDEDKSPDKETGCGPDEGASAQCSEQQDVEDRYTMS